MLICQPGHTVHSGLPCREQASAPSSASSLCYFCCSLFPFGVVAFVVVVVVATVIKLTFALMTR